MELCPVTAVVEVKCPYNVKDDKWILKRDHQYFYQIQMQMKFCGALYCDFVVWTKSNTVIERSIPDPQFIDSKLDIIKDFFLLWNYTRDRWEVVHKEACCKL